MPESSIGRITDGSLDFSDGINSATVPTIQSDFNPNGLKRSELAWLHNATVRGGGILQRTGWQRLIKGFSADSQLFQGAMVYKPITVNQPYLIASISGRTYRFNVYTDNSVADITGIGANINPATQPRYFFVQGEEFAVIQVGDFTTQALIWDGATMRRSLGVGGGAPTTEVPPGAAMDYWKGRLWVQTDNRAYSASNLIYGADNLYPDRSGILKWSENGYFAGGGSLNIPGETGSIRALKHTSNMDATLGQGDLYIFTRDAIFALTIPISRIDWNAAGADAPPLLRMVQQRYGAVSDWAVVPVNTDLFYRSFDGVRSLQVSSRFMHQWGQVPLSRDENRVLAFDDRSLLRFGSGVEFDNRLLNTVLPFQTPVGVCHQGLIPYDFDIISGDEERKKPPAWEGMYEGLDFLQVLKSDFGGLERCFAFVRSRQTQKIEVWELTNFLRFDQPQAPDDVRVTWYFETPAYNGGNSFQLKKLEAFELWIDKLFGTTDITVEYRADSDPCWYKWAQWRECAARTSCETVDNPVCYPEQGFCEQFRTTRVSPTPPSTVCGNSGRPSHIGYQFQLRITIHGWARIRGVLIHMWPQEQAPFDNMIPCDLTSDTLNGV
jgi:hypothetical protein